MTTDPGSADPEPADLGALGPAAVGLPEEPWEADVGALLGALPPVDPPEGFIASALDHRPLYAGRIVVGLLGGFAAMVVLAFVVTTSDESDVGRREPVSGRPLTAQTGLDTSGDGRSPVQWLDDHVAEMVAQLGFPTE